MIPLYNKKRRPLIRSAALLEVAQVVDGVRFVVVVELPLPKPSLLAEEGVDRERAFGVEMPVGVFPPALPAIPMFGSHLVPPCKSVRSGNDIHE